jgi:triosephosphate isomerase (TIM)
MTSTLRPLIAGNWKMNGLHAQLGEVDAIAAALAAEPARARVALCPPATLISRLSARLEGTAVEVGAQDLHPEVSGAYTGDIAAGMLFDAGARLVIIGHSERRTLHREDDVLIARKVEAALHGGLEPIVCVGETLEERKAGNAEAVVCGQIEGSLPLALEGHGFAVAYEPVWAIGTGLTPTAEEIAAMHAAIRAAVVARIGEAGRQAPILYGGSVKPSNAAEILALPEVGGALVGGASLKAADFLPIVRAA